jgi:hypothetical protein
MTLTAAITGDRGPRVPDAPVARRRAPLVGYVSIGNTIDVVETTDRLIVRLSSGTQRFLLLAAAIFGPLATAVVVLVPSVPNPHTPAIIKAVFFATIFAAWGFLPYTLVTRPRLEITRASGDIEYFRRGRTPARVIHQNDIAGVKVSDDAYISGRFKTANRVISVLVHDEAIPLCASPDFNLIASLAQKIATLTRTRILNSTNGQVN